MEAPGEIAVETLSEPLQITAGSAEPTVSSAAGLDVRPREQEDRGLRWTSGLVSACCHRLRDNTDLVPSHILPAE